MGLPLWKRGVLLVAGLAALYLLYGFGLDGAGMLGPDEPRYAAIGRAMAETGDWVTPRLWDEPWFEKPALLYWMTATGFKAGLNPDLAPRVPVALASVAFLVFFGVYLGREFGSRAALYATAILATSAGWLTYSHIGVTDLPLAVCFSVAMLLMMPGVGTVKPVWAGVFLGLAVLAKGLVPFVLIVPAFWFLRKRWKDLAAMLAVAVLIATPWYALVIVRNGQPFIDEFFWKHHFARFMNGSLQHVRPVWFFVPILWAGFFPWTPMLALLLRGRLYRDQRAQFLVAWAAFGLLFFSLSDNKLPGYVLPLMPAIAGLLGLQLAQAYGRTAPILAASLLGCAAALLGLIPVVAQVLPTALLKGASSVTPAVPIELILVATVTGLLVGWLCFRWNNAGGVGIIGAGVIAGVIFLIRSTFPALDQSVSARGFWRVHGAQSCVESGTRSWQYGLDYYARREVPDCGPKP